MGRPLVGYAFRAEHHQAELVERIPTWAWRAAAGAIAVGVVVLSLATITARHEARRAEQAVCAAKLETYFVRNPRLRTSTVRFSDDCATLRANGQ